MEGIQTVKNMGWVGEKGRHGEKMGGLMGLEDCWSGGNGGEMCGACWCLVCLVRALHAGTRVKGGKWGVNSAGGGVRSAFFVTGAEGESGIGREGCVVV